MEVGQASTDDELVAIQQLRHDVYVEDKGWFAAQADHEQRRLADVPGVSSKFLLNVARMLSARLGAANDA